ncbi:MAG TPA: DUF2017 domain-containing protein [Streptosporangiaceae bacterium]|nr:DUF2017 domain-containing protein [Streptosporangiaceae bacterium]
MSDGSDFDPHLDPEEPMAGFRRTGDGVTARFARPEAAIIRDLVEQVVELVEPDLPSDRGSGGTGDPEADELAAMVGMSDGDFELPDDPVLARLLPDAYREDPDAAQEFRRFTESGLRSAKVECAQTLLDTLPADGGRVRLNSDQAEAWLRSLNDVRLALGVRLGVTDDFDALDEDVEPEDPRFAYVQVYQWLAYIQGSLVAALS